MAEDSNPIAPRSVWPRIIWASAALLSYILVSIVVLVIEGSSRGKVLFHSDQPSNVHYGSFEPYELRVQEGPQKWQLFLWDEHYSIVEISTKGNDFSYSTSMNFDQMGNGTPTGATWSDKGIELTYSSGVRLFIPKGLFIGGR